MTNHKNITILWNPKKSYQLECHHSILRKCEPSASTNIPKTQAPYSNWQGFRIEDLKLAVHTLAMSRGDHGSGEECTFIWRHKHVYGKNNLYLSLSILVSLPPTDYHYPPGFLLPLSIPIFLHPSSPSLPLYTHIATRGIPLYPSLYFSHLLIFLFLYSLLIFLLPSYHFSLLFFFISLFIPPPILPNILSYKVNKSKIKIA